MPPPSPITDAPHAVWLTFFLLLGSCVGSFLNVVVYRLPLGQSLSHPPSRCPKCGRGLAWHDNIPVLGWLMLRGKCRWCALPISARYPIVEAVTALLFAGWYAAYFMAGWGPCGEMFFPRDWPVLAIHLFLVSSLLAASLIDAELYVIPQTICWLTAAVAIGGYPLAHGLSHGTLVGVPIVTTAPVAAIAAGGTIGLIFSLGLLYAGVLPTSFKLGEPMLEVDREQLAADPTAASDLPPEYSNADIRREIAKEMVFLMPPLLLAGAAAVVATRNPGLFRWAIATPAASAALGSLLGALIGGGIVWLFRIFGTLAFRRVAMGLGDVHLMFGVGAVTGGLLAAVAFFIAPFAGLTLALYFLVTRSRREIPYGPYLAAAAAAVLLAACRFEHWLGPAWEAIVWRTTGAE